MPIVHPTGLFLDFNRAHVWEDNGIRLELPKGTLYEDIYFTTTRSKGNSHADVIRLHKNSTPLHAGVPLSFRINNDTVSRKSQYYLAKRNAAGVWANAGSGTYENGWLTTLIKDFGTYTVLTDVTPPKITAMDSKNAVKNRLFRIRVTDDASGVETWRGTIDGKWVLFTFNTHSSELRYVFDTDRLTKNSRHELVLSVTDACGNTRSYSHSFYY